MWKALELPKMSKKLNLKRSWTSWDQKKLPVTITHKIFETISTLQIPNSLGDKFAQLYSQNETLITHYENKNRDHAKCFLFWENHVSLRIYLIELISKWVEYGSLIVF